MNPNRPKVNENGRYSIKQTHTELGIDRGTLYKYTHVTNELPCDYRQEGGRLRKFYLGRDILQFWDSKTGKYDTSPNY